MPRDAMINFRFLLAGLALGFAARLPAAEPTEASAVLKSVPPVFPPELQAKGVAAGRAQVAVTIDPSGRVTDCLVEADTDPAFGPAAVAAVRQWIFNRAAIAEEDGDQIIDVDLAFGNKPEAAQIPWTYRVPLLNQLDQIPHPSHMVRPALAKDPNVDSPTGHVTVVFYIDETGHVRMPAVAVGVNPELDQASLSAVAQWQFDPPLMQGKPTLVRSQQTFRFGPHGTLKPDVIIKPPLRVAEYTMPGPLFGAAAVADNDAIYMISGKGNPLAPLFLHILRFDLHTHEFKILAEDKIMPRIFGGAALVDGKIYLLGGDGGVANTWKHTQIYDIAKDTVAAGPLMPNARANFATGVIGRRIYLAGGGIAGLEPTSSVDYLDLDQGNWGHAPKMPVRGFVAGAVPPNGRLLVVPSEKWGTPYVARRSWAISRKTVLVYDPVTQKWRRRSRLAWPIEASTVQTVNWRLYLFGNYNEVEIFDLQSGVSQPFMLPPGGGFGATSAVVGDKIYLIGGTLDPRRGLTSRMLQVYQTQ